VAKDLGRASAGFKAWVVNFIFSAEKDHAMQSDIRGRRSRHGLRALFLAPVFALSSCNLNSTPSGGAATEPSGTVATTQPTTHPAPVARVRNASGVAGVYDVRAFGAVGDGKTIDSPAINKAIETAAAAGGGTVRFPAGTYLSYSIRLKSNITLYLDQGSRILAANKLIHGGDGYDAPEDIGDTARYQDYGHSHWHNSLIWAENMENITITGPGLIDGGFYTASQGTITGLNRGAGGAGFTPPGGGRGFGRGAATQPGGRGFGRGATTGPGGRGFGRGRPDTIFSTDLSVPFRDTGALPAGVGNKAVSLKLCKNVTLSQFSVLRAGHFMLLATGVDNLTIDGLKVDTNRDGFDIDGCRNVRVANCSINSPQDDAIVLKSTWGLGYSRDCDNVTITNCLVCGGWEVGSMLDATYVERAPGTGRIKFGTESNGGFKNITISNCVFDRCQGLALEAVDGAVIDNISISNITMREIGSLPIFIRLGNRARMPADKVRIGEIHHVNISDIEAQNRAAQYACIISGIPGHPIEDVRISNVRIIWPGGQPAEAADRQVPENQYMYPEPGMFGAMPAYGFFIRHVNGIELSNIEMSYRDKDMRPPFYLEDVKVAEFNHIKAPREEGVPLFNLKNVEDFRTHEVRGMADTTKDKVETGKL
jgi:polygalacturonase